MNIKDIVNGFVAKQIPGNIIYSYFFSLRKLKVLSVHEKTHSAFILDTSTGLTELKYDYEEGYFLTPEKAIEFRKKCVQNQLKRLRTEMEQLNRMKV